MRSPTRVKRPARANPGLFAFRCPKVTRSKEAAGKVAASSRVAAQGNESLLQAAQDRHCVRVMHLEYSAHSRLELDLSQAGWKVFSHSAVAFVRAGYPGRERPYSENPATYLRI